MQQRLSTFPLTVEPVDSNGDGISDQLAKTLGLDPFAPNADTDNDGLADAAEIGDLNAPSDTDGDGVIDALEAGGDANNATVISGLRLPGGSSADLSTGNSERLSKAVATPITAGPDGITFPFGLISYTTTAPLGGSATVRISFPANLPDNLVVFKVNHASLYTQLPAGSWTRVDPRTVEITLKDGDPAMDLDGVANGSIDDPIAVGASSVTTDEGGTSTNASGGGGGGGCVFSAHSDQDPLLVLIMLLSVGWIVRLTTGRTRN